MSKMNTPDMYDLIKKNNRKLLLARYQDIRFLNDSISSELLCSRCRRVAITHSIASCGHLYCEECLDKLYTTTYNVRGCVACGAIITGIFTMSVGIELRICSLMVKCPNSQFGCLMSATLMEIGNHISDCKFSDKVFGLERHEFWSSEVANEIKLITGSRSENMMQRFSDFKREIKHVMIDEFKKLEHNMAESSFDRSLSPPVVASPNSLEKHLKLLEENVKTKKRLQEQEKQKSLEAIDKIKISYIDEYFTKNLKPLHCLIPQSSTVFTWVIDKVRDKMMEQKEIESPEFKIRNQLISVQAKCEFPSGQIGLRFLAPKDQPQFPRPYPRVTYTIFNIVGLGKYERIERVEEIPFGPLEKFESQQYDRYKTDFGADIISQSTIKNDTVTLFISIDFPNHIEKPFSCDGVLIWRFEEFIRKFRHANRQWLERFYSPYFSTSPKGYRIKAEIHNNLLFSSQSSKSGMRKVPIFIHFVNGEFDHLLTDTKVSISVALYNHKLLSMDPVDATENNGNVCQLHLPSLDQLDHYLMDDVITIQVTVKVIY